MFLPHTKIEKALLQESANRIIIGIDEAGRGPLAGPVVAAAAWINPVFFEKDFKENNLIRDSKTLSFRQRNKIFQIICQQEKDFIFGIGIVSNLIIDQINILNATFLAMRLALDDLKNKINADQKNLPFILLIDGNKKIPKITTPQKIFIGGDRDIFSISVASICAKVWRDELMEDFHKKYPAYGFNCHRGYGTKLHYEMIKKHGICKIHRESFHLGI